MEVTDSEIMEYLGHNGNTCKVIIGNEGYVVRYGYPHSTGDRMSKWRFVGHRDDIVREMNDDTTETGVKL